MKKYINKILNSFEEQKRLLSGAGEVFKLESNLKNYYHKNYVVTFSSASQAILTTVIALDIQDTEIIVSPLTWGGSLAPFLLFNNRVKISDIDFDNYSMRIDSIKNQITNKTKVILSTDFAGNATDSFMISEIAKKNDILFISDSSQSFGAFDNKDKPSGFYADIIVLSFGPTKTLFGGEGGAILTNDFTIYKRLVANSQHQDRQKKISGLKNPEMFGINGRINPFAAYIINKFWNKSLTKLKRKQNKYYKIYQKLLKEGLIKRKDFLKSPQNSTFWLPLFEKMDLLIKKKPAIGIKISDYDFSEDFITTSLEKNIKYYRLFSNSKIGSQIKNSLEGKSFVLFKV